MEIKYFILHEINDSGMGFGYDKSYSIIFLKDNDLLRLEKINVKKLVDEGMVIPDFIPTNYTVKEDSPYYVTVTNHDVFVNFKNGISDIHLNAIAANLLNVISKRLLDKITIFGSVVTRLPTQYE